MAIERFEVGKKYRWVGPVQPSEFGISDIASKQWMKRRPHKCKLVRGSQAGFVGIKKGYEDWWYGGFEKYFEEVVE